MTCPGDHFMRCQFCKRLAPMNVVTPPTHPGGATKVMCCVCGRRQSRYDHKERERLVRESEKRYYERTGKKPKKKRVQQVGQVAIDRYNALPNLPAGLEGSLCFAYGRISVDEEESVSIQAQQMRIDEFYARSLKPQGIQFYPNGYFWDIGTSGGRLMAKRAAGGTLLSTLRRGDHVIISKVDRAYRDMEDALRGLRQLKERGVTAHFVDIPELPDGAAGELVFGILALAAQFERRRIGERTKEALAYRRKMGQAVGNAPTGWQQIGFKATARFIPNPEVRELGNTVVALREAGLQWWDVKSALVQMGLAKHGAADHELRNVKDLYIRTKLRWPKCSVDNLKRWLLSGHELGLKALAACDDQAIDAMLRNRESLRQFLRAAWDAAAQSEVGKQNPMLQRREVAAADQGP